MKKRVLITIHYMEIGGVEISLIGLLKAFDYTRYDVDLFIYSHQGEYMKQIPPDVNILPEVEKYSMIERPIVEVVKKGFYAIALARIWAMIQSKVYYKFSCSTKENFSIFHYAYSNMSPLLPKINPDIEYDLAIGFLFPFHILNNKIRAKKRIGWIHTDFNSLALNSKAEYPIWDGCDYIASISRSITKSFRLVFPELGNKIVLIENILSPSFVRERAEERIVDDEIYGYNEGVTLLSIGRFSHSKNFDNIPWICKLIRDSGLNVKWFIIGYGGDLDLIQEQILKTAMQDFVILLGKKSNPYPYIKACDVYIQPSRYEGKSVTVREAQILCKPVVITDFPTSASQLQDGKDGIIVPLDNKLCAKGLIRVIQDKKLQQQIVAYLQTHDYGNEQEVEKIYQLI